MPHGQCFYWRADLLALHVLGDGITALSYYVIPAALIVFVYRRSRRHNDVRFGWLFVMFAGFILACGTTHLLGVWTLWVPHYWLSGVAKLVTAGISATTAFMLWPLIPKAVNLPSAAELEATNRALQAEISKRRAREAELERVNAELDRLNAENLSRRRRAEQAQLYSEASLSALYEALPDAILQTDSQDMVVRAKEPHTFAVTTPSNALVGQPLINALEVMPDNVKSDFMTCYQQARQTDTMQTLEYSVLDSDQPHQQVHREARTIPLDMGGCVLLIRDISERKRATLALEQALSEKVTLLRELHHRVKNNLQVIASMLSLQASAAPNAAAREVLRESYHRVHVMAEVHQQFYDVQHSDAKVQHISQYLRELINNLTTTLSAGSKQTTRDLEVRLDIEDIAVPIDQIVPLGLIANELLTNVFKYAFPAEFAGLPLLWVALSVREGQLCLLVRDNGVGLNDAARAASSSSLGMGIVNALSGQLGGQTHIRDASEATPADMPHLDAPAALADSSGTVAQVCIPYQVGKVVRD